MFINARIADKIIMYQTMKSLEIIIQKVMSYIIKNYEHNPSFQSIINRG